MHLRNASRLAEGDQVEPGERFAGVGRTGRATAATCTSSCGPRPAGTGAARAFDPLGKLRLWDGWSQG